LSVRTSVLTACALAGLLVLMIAGRAMAAAKAPEVGYHSASQVSTTGATIEVPINPEGGETSWEIWLECQSADKYNQTCQPLTVGSQRQQGVLPAGFESQIVTDSVTGLQPDYLYKYRVVAVNSAGKEGYAGDGFVTCPSEGLCPPQPYLRGESLWSIEGSERVAREAVEHARNEATRREQEREAKKREEERPLKEAEERAAKEREAREAGERAGREAAERAARSAPAATPAAAATPTPRCVVPRLRGDSLTQARRVLGRAHCRLGRLTEPRGYHGPLVVVRQNIRSGSKRAAGTRVALTLSRGRGR
jgi:hypothetical protein